MKRYRTSFPLVCLLASLLAGCANMPFGGAAKTAANAASAAASQSGLKEGIALYNNGDYNGAIKRLAMADVAGGSKATQLEALKYSAFSYCVTARQRLCRLQFDKAFKLDPSFDLDPGEHGHPNWGPVFVKAKKSK